MHLWKGSHKSGTESLSLRPVPRRLVSLPTITDNTDLEMELRLLAVSFLLPPLCNLCRFCEEVRSKSVNISFPLKFSICISFSLQRSHGSLFYSMRESLLLSLLAGGSPFTLARAPLTRLQHSLSTSVLPGTTRCSRLILCFLWPGSEISCFSRGASFYWGMVSINEKLEARHA